MVVLLGEFDLLSVELPYSGDFKTFVDDSWSLSLGFGENDVNEVTCCRNNSNLLEVVVSHVFLQYTWFIVRFAHA